MSDQDILITALRSMEAWVKHWQKDARCNLKPTPESLADALSEIRVALGLAGVKAQSATEMLTAALNALVDEYCEYMRINNLRHP